MSNDLISRKALINALFVHNGKMWPDTDIDNFPTTINVKDVKEAIRNAPTAYDVDKVVELLESILEDVNMQLELSKDFQPKESESVKSNIVFFAEKKRMCEELIKIVKSGGIE